MLAHQPPSFYVSFPLRTLVIHPYRPDFSNELLPKLHAELWSDWFGVIHRQSPTHLERVTASSQSVLGFVGDALALGGLVALAVPAAFRVLRRRSRAPADVGLGLLALLALVSFAAFVVTLIRFPQQLRRPDQVELPPLHHPRLGGVLDRRLGWRCSGTDGSQSRSSRSPASTSSATRPTSAPRSRSRPARG